MLDIVSKGKPKNPQAVEAPVLKLSLVKLRLTHTSCNSAVVNIKVQCLRRQTEGAASAVLGAWLPGCPLHLLSVLPVDGYPRLLHAT